jgi:hypothetical protein
MLQQRLGDLQVGRVETFGEPAVDLGEHRTRLVATPSFGEQSREADACLEFAGLCAHPLGQFDRRPEASLRFVDLGRVLNKKQIALEVNQPCLINKT